ncbi:MAG TPA: peptidylprolyl isomerase [Pyrinomonadaceae bacterium]|nr:peptidylprolyl isomerase [Pyrinomonadaceae bacterium]
MKKTLILFIISASLAAGIFLVWQNQNERARAAKLDSEILKGLTAEEIGLILKSEALADRQSIAAIQQSNEKRQAFLKGMREYLALAGQARREGFADDANFKINAEYKKNILLADLYRAKLGYGQEKSYVVPEDEIKAVWANSENENSFNRDIKTLKEIQKAAAAVTGNQAPVSELAGENLTKARINWARTKILSERAKADAEFMRQPEIPLRLKIVEAGILANDYLRANWTRRLKASDREISAYLKSHPEYDVEKKRQTAETVLQKAKAGEDFTKLAAEFSEDRSTKDKGGLYQNVNKNVLWAEVEDAALNLEKGQIADRVVESNIGYHIVKLEGKKNIKNKDGGEKVNFSIRHVLLQKNFEEPNNKIPGIPPPFMKAEEIAEAEIEKEKRALFINEINKQNAVSLPENFTVELPEVGNVGANEIKPELPNPVNNSK